MHYKPIPFAPLFQEFLNETGPLLNAATVHHYYMHGQAANTSSYLDSMHLQEVLVHYNTSSYLNPMHLQEVLVHYNTSSYLDPMHLQEVLVHNPRCLQEVLVHNPRHLQEVLVHYKPIPLYLCSRSF